MSDFKQNLLNTSPIHDNPSGLIHPYWARKPLNIIESIVCNFSEKGDTVADPFMGSGTTIVAALKNQRNALGSDLSPISHLLVDGIISSIRNPSKFKFILEQTIKDWIEFSIKLYSLDNNRCVERENFIVEGEYINGNFKLIFDEAKVKPSRNNKVKGKIEKLNIIEYLNQIPTEFLIKPVDFSKILYTENSRIAVHKGSKASDFFTKRNIVFINYAKDYIRKNHEKLEEINFLKLFLSSMIPLLRLSDKKASSQWPYWRPKTSLTSRNPIVAINRRHKAYLELFQWFDGKVDIKSIEANIYNISANHLFNEFSKPVDLIVTDPPYADHAPYMEYSDLYWSIIGDKRTKKLWGEEIVKTNAVGRENDSLQYEARMYAAITAIIKGLKVGGYFVFFYLDKNIQHWATIKSSLKSAHCNIEEVISIPKQRKSMKSVTSPGKTLDGDIIIVCKKHKENQIPEQPIKSIHRILIDVKGATYFDRFSYFIEEFLMNKVDDLDRKNYNDISKYI